MSSESSDPYSVRLNQVIADCVAAVESGNAPDREELIGRHPELADDLRSFFADHDRMKAAKEGVESPTLPPRPSDTEAATIPPGAVMDSPTLLPGQPATHADEAALPPRR